MSPARSGSDVEMTARTSIFEGSILSVWPGKVKVWGSARMVVIGFSRLQCLGRTASDEYEEAEAKRGTECSSDAVRRRGGAWLRFGLRRFGLTHWATSADQTSH